MAKVYNELSNYQNVPRELVFDNTLSDRARFVYIFMACKPDGWKFFLEPMAKEIGYSKDTLRKYINELVDNGWLLRGEQINENGQFGAVDYTIKATKFSDTEKFRHGKNPTQYNKDIIKKRDNNIKEKDSIEKEKLQEFVDKIYGMYPSKCTVRNVSTGKCRKDKERIIKLMKTYSMEEIEMVVKHEVDSKLGKHPLKNFSTFLNNFPDPKEISEVLYYPKSIEDVKDDDIKPTFTLFLDWLDDAAKKILETNRKGFPLNEKQYKRLIDVAIGGKRTLAYVTLVLNRDGYGVYADERGFMWTYLNYIKANGLYKG